MQQMDYIVIGGGSSGCAVAGRLSELPNASVLLLEAGGEGDNWIVNTPLAFVLMSPNKINNWAFNTIPQKGLNGRIGYQPRGKVLGGSSAINAMVYVRGHRDDYDHWAALGNSGWSYQDVLPYFKKAEHNHNFNDAWHGQNGPLHVSRPQSDNPFQQRFLSAAQQAGFKANADFNGAEQEGAGLYQATQNNGQRCSAYHAYIKPHLKRSNLHIETGAMVQRIIFEGKRAVGVQYQKNGQMHVVYARREVILSAGALQSPQLLMLSGIGDRDELKQHNIALVQHLPGVGKNLQDHADLILGYKSSSRDLFGVSVRGMFKLAKDILHYRKTRRGLLSSNLAEGGIFVKTDPSFRQPNIQIIFALGLVDDHARAFHYGHGISCHVCLLRPKSTGRVSLQDSNPASPPLIDPNYFEHEEDIEQMVAGYKAAQRLMHAPALASFITKDVFSSHVKTDDDIRQLLRQRVDTLYHVAGTCKMGVDDMAVVDANLKVHGIEGLRVVDASVMPSMIGGNTNAATIMIGEKAADMIKLDWAKVVDITGSNALHS